MVGQKAKLTALRLGTDLVPSRWREAMPLTLMPTISSVPLLMIFRVVDTPAKSSVFGPLGTARARQHSVKDLNQALQLACGFCR